MLPGAVLAHVAASHLRVGTFQFAAATGDLDLLQRLCSYALERHYPTADRSERPALALLAAVVESQARLIAQWMSVGFIHGVMNTDNTTISGETIDYGPCAWMDHYDLETKYSSIDHDGRYAFGNQPAIGHWNCYRFAESLLPLIDPDVESAIGHATEVLSSYDSLYDRFWTAAMAEDRSGQHPPMFRQRGGSRQSFLRSWPSSGLTSPAPFDPFLKCFTAIPRPCVRSFWTSPNSIVGAKAGGQK